MFNEIADKYAAKQPWALDSLPKKIRGGGVGVWGNVNMPAHPGVSLNDARTIVNYILHVKEKNISTLPLKGNYTQQIPAGDNGKGSLIVRAAYTDKGAAGATTLTTEKVLVLHSPHLSPSNADIIKDAEIKKQLMFVVSVNLIPKNNGYIGFKKVDISGIKQLELNVSANPQQGFIGGTIEIRLGSPTGELIGQTEVLPVNPFAALMNAANATQNAGGSKNSSGVKPVSVLPKAPAKKPAFNLAALFSKPGMKVNIKESQGEQDVYLVFKNTKAKPAEPLLSISDIQLNDVVKPDDKPKP